MTRKEREELSSKPSENAGTERPGKKRRESSSFKWISWEQSTLQVESEWVFCACSKVPGLSILFSQLKKKAQ